MELEASHSIAVGHHHAAGDDARSQLIAALMLRGAPWAELVAKDGADANGIAASDAGPRNTEVLPYLKRAFVRGGDDPLVLWLLANQSYRPEARALAEAAAQRLVEVDAGNAAAWLLLLELGRDTLTDAEQDVLLARAAAAERHAFYHMEFVRMLVRAYATVPVPPELTEAIKTDVPSAPAEAVPYVRAIGVSMALAIPSAGTASALCRNATSAARLESCMALGRLLSTRSEEFVGQSLGMALLQRAADSPSARAEADEVHRINTWRQAAYLEVIEAASSDGFAWSVFGRHWPQPGVSEVEARARALVAAGVPLEPPADFSVPHEQPTSRRVGAEKTR